MLRFLKIAKFEIVILIFGEVLSKIITPSQLMLAASILKTFPEFWSLRKEINSYGTNFCHYP